MVAIQFYGGHPVCMPLIVGHSAIQQQLYCKLISGKYECCLTHNLESSLFDSLNYFMYDISGLCVVRPKNDRCCMTLAALHQSDTAHSKKIPVTIISLYSNRKIQSIVIKSPKYSLKIWDASGQVTLGHLQSGQIYLQFANYLRSKPLYSCSQNKV